MTEFVIGVIVGTNVPLVLNYTRAQLSRRRRSKVPLQERSELAFDALRRIALVPKVEHAHKIAARTLNALD